MVTWLFEGVTDREARTFRIEKSLPETHTYDASTDRVSIPYIQYRELMKKANAVDLDEDHKVLIRLLIQTYQRALFVLNVASFIAVGLSLYNDWPLIPSLVSYIIFAVCCILPADGEYLEKIFIGKIKRDMNE